MRLRMFWHRVWAARQEIGIVIAVILAALGLFLGYVGIRYVQSSVPPLVPVRVCVAARSIKAGELFERNTLPVSCVDVQVVLPDIWKERNYRPFDIGSLPEYFVALVDMPEGAVISAHEFSPIVPVGLPLLLVPQALEARGRYALSFPIPKGEDGVSLEMLRGYVGASVLIVEGYCYALTGDGCLFLVERFSLRDDADNVLMSVQGDAYQYLNLLSTITGWAVWRYDYPVPPIQ